MECIQYVMLIHDQQYAASPFWGSNMQPRVQDSIALTTDLQAQSTVIVKAAILVVVFWSVGLVCQISIPTATDE